MPGLWGGVWASWGDVLVAWAVALPLAAAAAWAAILLRVRQGMPRAKALRYSIAEVGLVCGTLPWVWMILTPRSAPDGVSLVPLRDLTDTLGGAPASAVVQVGANLLLFVPLGFFLPLRARRFAGVARMTAVGAVLSGSLEAAQYAFALGRVASVDDLLMNAVGAGIGAWGAQMLVARRESAPSRGGL